MTESEPVGHPAPGPVGAGSGGPEAGVPAGETLYRYTRDWRWTRLDGITWSIAVCMACRRVVKPTSIRRTRSGTHGEDYYEHEHPLKFVLLTQSNSGIRHYYIDMGLEFLDELVRSLWIFRRLWPQEVIEEIEKSLG